MIGSCDDGDESFVSVTSYNSSDSWITVNWLWKGPYHGVWCYCV